jgi:hypothetical protein
MSLEIGAFMTTMLDLASQFFNALIPIIAVLVGISLGVGLAFLVYKIISNVFPTHVG